MGGKKEQPARARREGCGEEGEERKERERERESKRAAGQESTSYSGGALTKKDSTAGYLTLYKEGLSQNPPPFRRWPRGSRREGAPAPPRARVSAWPHRRRGRPPPARGGGSDRRGPLLGVPKCLAGVRRSCPGSRQGPTWSGLPRRPPARLVVSVFVQGPTSTVLFVSFSLCFSFCSARYPAPLRQNEKRNEAPNPAKQR